MNKAIQGEKLKMFTVDLHSVSSRLPKLYICNDISVFKVVNIL